MMTWVSVCSTKSAIGFALLNTPLREGACGGLCTETFGPSSWCMLLCV